MRQTTLLSAVVAATFILLSMTFASSVRAASKEQVLYSFDEGNNGAYPLGGVASDAKGNLYGTTELAGANGAGIVFELTPESDGSWTFTLLHTFEPSVDGGNPVGGLAFDNSGSLYGTASDGGSFSAGTVYQLTPDANGWKYNVIYAFRGGNDAAYPSGPLLFDGKDTFYGTAGGGSSGNCTIGCGTVFQLKHSRSGKWFEEVLHRFQGGGDGDGPVGGLARDFSGNLYGITSRGGLNQCNAGCGTVFKLYRGSKGWKKALLYGFTGTNDGYFSYGGPAFDKAGNLYGTTLLGGGSCNCGTVFKLAKNGKHTVLHRFTQTAGDGAYPMAGLVLGAGGTLYGTTAEGGKQFSGCGGGCGIVFKMKDSKLNVLYSFDEVHGAMPETPLFWDGAGYLFGTTFGGGARFVGTVFKLTLNP